MDKPAVERTVVRDRASETNMVFQFAAETIQTAYRRYASCKPAVKMKRLSSMENVVAAMAADAIKFGMKRLSLKSKASRSASFASRSSASLSGSTINLVPPRSIRIDGISVSKLPNVHWNGENDLCVVTSLHIPDASGQTVECVWEQKTPIAWESGVSGRWKQLRWCVSLPAITESVREIIPKLLFEVFHANVSRGDILIGQCWMKLSEPASKAESSLSRELDVLIDTGSGPMGKSPSMSSSKSRKVGSLAPFAKFQNNAGISFSPLPTGGMLSVNYQLLTNEIGAGEATPSYSQDNKSAASALTSPSTVETSNGIAFRSLDSNDAAADPMKKKSLYSPRVITTTSSLDRELLNEGGYDVVSEFTLDVGDEDDGSLATDSIVSRQISSTLPSPRVVAQQADGLLTSPITTTIPKAMPTVVLTSHNQRSHTFSQTQLKQADKSLRHIPDKSQCISAESSKAPSPSNSRRRVSTADASRRGVEVSRSYGSSSPASSSVSNGTRRSSTTRKDTVGDSNSVSKSTKVPKKRSVLVLDGAYRLACKSHCMKISLKSKEMFTLLKAVLLNHESSHTDEWETFFASPNVKAIPTKELTELPLSLIPLASTMSSYLRDLILSSKPNSINGSAMKSQITEAQAKLTVKELLCLLREPWLKVRKFILHQCSGSSKSSLASIASNDKSLRPSEWPAAAVQSLWKIIGAPLELLSLDKNNNDASETSVSFLSACDGRDLIGKKFSDVVARNAVGWTCMSSIIKKRLDIYTATVQILDDWWGEGLRPQDKHCSTKAETGDTNAIPSFLIQKMSHVPSFHGKVRENGVNGDDEITTGSKTKACESVASVSSDVDNVRCVRVASMDGLLHAWLPLNRAYGWGLKLDMLSSAATVIAGQVGIVQTISNTSEKGCVWVTPDSTISNQLDSLFDTMSPHQFDCIWNSEHNAVLVPLTVLSTVTYRGRDDPSKLHEGDLTIGMNVNICEYEALRRSFERFDWWDKPADDVLKHIAGKVGEVISLNDLATTNSRVGVHVLGTDITDAIPLVSLVRHTDPVNESNGHGTFGREPFGHSVSMKSMNSTLSEDVDLSASAKSVGTGVAGAGTGQSSGKESKFARMLRCSTENSIGDDTVGMTIMPGADRSFRGPRHPTSTNINTTVGNTAPRSVATTPVVAAQHTNKMNLPDEESAWLDRELDLNSTHEDVDVVPKVLTVPSVKVTAFKRLDSSPTPSDPAPSSPLKSPNAPKLDSFGWIRNKKHQEEANELYADLCQQEVPPPEASYPDHIPVDSMPVTHKPLTSKDSSTGTGRVRKSKPSSNDSKRNKNGVGKDNQGAPIGEPDVTSTMTHCNLQFDEPVIIDDPLYRKPERKSRGKPRACVGSKSARAASPTVVSTPEVAPEAAHTSVLHKVTVGDLGGVLNGAAATAPQGGPQTRMRPKSAGPSTGSTRKHDGNTSFGKPKNVEEKAPTKQNKFSLSNYDFEPVTTKLEEVPATPLYGKQPSFRGDGSPKKHPVVQETDEDRQHRPTAESALPSTFTTTEIFLEAPEDFNEQKEYANKHARIAQRENERKEKILLRKLKLAAAAEGKKLDNNFNPVLS